MPTELVFDSLDAIPEPLRDAFIEQNGRFVPAGFVPKPTHEEMVRGLKAKVGKLSEAEKALSRLEGVDLDELLASKTELEKLRNEAQAREHGKTPEELDKLFADRYARTTADFQNKLAAAEKARQESEQLAEKLRTELHQHVVDNSFRAGAAKLAAKGFKATVNGVVRDLVTLARAAGWTVEDGQPVLRRADGAIELGADGKSNLSPEEWILGTKEDSPHWWTAPGSGGNTSTGGLQGSGGAIVLTREQAKDPAQYRAAKEAAAKRGVAVEIAA